MCREATKDNREEIYACLEHVDMAIDEFLVDVEDAPNITEVENDKLKCMFCEEKAKYKLS